MAVGDVVNGIQAGGDFTFQPAASVEVCLTYFGSWSNSSQLVNGTIVAYMKQTLAASTMSATANKLFINNTNYINILADNNGSIYTGVQTQ
tara:strand:- start:43 stop:315 length:273 start_codon:yes stop_codon:yes gene_type:complete